MTIPNLTKQYQKSTAMFLMHHCASSVQPLPNADTINLKNEHIL